MKASLRTKFIIFITIAIVAFDIVFLMISVNLYNKDKESYVYENVYNSNWAITQLLNKHLDHIRLLSNLDFKGLEELQLPKSLSIENILLFDGKKKKYVYELTPSVTPLVSLEKELNRYLETTEDEIQVALTKDGVFLSYWRLLPSRLVLKIVSNVSKLVQSFHQQGLYSIYFFDRKSDIVLSLPSKSTNFNIDTGRLKELVKGSSQEGARDLNLGGEEFITVVSQTSDKLLKVVTLIPKSVAFSASKNLIYQNIALAVIFIGLSIIIILFLAKLITNPLGELTRVAESAGNGQYDQQIKNTSGDEIGILIRAFNKMFADIKKYTEELKVKYRIENEIKLAKGVQEQYIPKVDFQNKNIKLAGFYLPASECSGDWWNYRVHDEVSYLFISDVTGHGLPSALLTSAVNSCCSTIDNQIKRSGVHPQPSEILKIINDVISQSASGLMLTMCVICIDHTKKKIIFSNASHEFPLLVSSQQIKSLVTRPGARLGESEASDYGDAEVTYSPGDILFLYTDGLVENSGVDGKPFGDRYLLRFLKKDRLPPDLLRNKLKESYIRFMKDGDNRDDVTFLFAELL